MTNSTSRPSASPLATRCCGHCSGGPLGTAGNGLGAAWPPPRPLSCWPGQAERSAGTRCTQRRVAAGRTWSGPLTGTLPTVSVTDPPRSYGAAKDVQVRGVPVGTDCQFQVTDSPGPHAIVGGWTATYRDGSVWYPGETSILAANVRSFQITSGGKVLISVPAR